MVARAGRGTKILDQQLPRSALTAESKHGEIEFGRAPVVRDGVFLEEADALTEGPLARFASYDADAAGKAHDDEVGFDRVVVEIEEQLQQAGGGTEERHFPAPKVGLERVEAPPELFKVPRVANPARNLKAFEVVSKRTAVTDDAVERVSALDDARDFAAEAEMAKPAPITAKDDVRVTTGEHGGVETGEGFLEQRRFDQLANQRRARPLAVGDGDADATHDFTVIGERLAKATRTAGELVVPAGRGRVVAMLLDDGKCRRGTFSATLFHREHTTAKAE